MKILLLFVLFIFSFQTSLLQLRNKIAQDKKVSAYDFHLNNIVVSEIQDNSFSVTGISSFPKETKAKIIYESIGNEILSQFELLPEKTLLSK